MQSSRRVTPVLVAATLALLPLALPAAAPNPSHVPARIDVRADSLGFYPYSNATLLAAEGHVRLRAGTRRIAADAIRIDLKTNRLVAAGNVVVTGRKSSLRVAAYALDLKTDRAEAIRLDPIPRTIALQDDDLATAREGPAPPDTFGLADLTGQRPYIESRSAVIQTNANIRMTPAEFPTSAGARGVLPTFVYTYQYNQLFGAQALPSTTIDYPYTLFGTPNSLTALHARYSQFDGVELGLDEHLVDGNREYVVGSILPFRGRRFDLNAYQQLRTGLTQTFTGSLSRGQVYGTYSILETAREFSVRASSVASNGYNDETLTVGSVNAAIRHLFRYATTVGYGYEHNPGQNPFYGDFNTFFTAQVSPKSLRLPYGVYGSAQYTYSLQKYDIPHLVTHGTATFSLASPTIKLVPNGSRNLAFFGTTSFENDATRYRDDARRFLGLPDPAYPYVAPDGTPDPGYFAYDGVSTQRTYALTTTVQAPRDFRLQLTLTHARDFPQGFGIGRAPLDAFADLTFRLTSTLKIELNRGYAFGVNGQRFSQYGVSFSP